MPSFLLPYKKYVGISLVALVGMIIAIVIITRQSESPISEPLPAVEIAANPQQKAEEQIPLKNENKPSTSVVVDVKGAVKHPGVYEFEQEARVEQAIEQAGGFTPAANKKIINLAAKLKDEMVIDVLTKKETPKEGSQQAGTMPTSAVSTSTSAMNEQPLVNLNTADETELQTLSGIGPAKSQAIIAYRTENGPFQAIEDLKKISGFGEKTFERLKPTITVQ
ncbi:MAG: helix-hairpin-helix domain-containing protein [Kurthia sp.]|nr:helix-hairpin-helix domain-containing protein [Candidatus Kurthia equi]